MPPAISSMDKLLNDFRVKCVFIALHQSFLCFSQCRLTGHQFIHPISLGLADVAIVRTKCETFEFFGLSQHSNCFVPAFLFSFIGGVRLTRCLKVSCAAIGTDAWTQLCAGASGFAMG